MLCRVAMVVDGNISHKIKEELGGHVVFPACDNALVSLGLGGLWQHFTRIEERV